MPRFRLTILASVRTLVSFRLSSLYLLTHHVCTLILTEQSIETLKDANKLLKARAEKAEKAVAGDLSASQFEKLTEDLSNANTLIEANKGIVEVSS